MQTEKLNVKDVYSGLLNQGKVNKNADFSSESDFTRMLKFSVSGDSLLDAGKISLASVKKASATLVLPEKNHNIVHVAKTDAAKKGVVKNAAKANDDGKAPIKDGDVKRGDEKTSYNDDDKTTTAKNKKDGDGVAVTDRKSSDKGKDDKECGDKIFAAGNEAIVFSPVVYKQDIGSNGDLNAEVVTAALSVAGDENSISLFNDLSADNDNTLFPLNDGTAAIDAAATNKTGKSDSTSDLNTVGENIGAAIFSRMAEKGSFKDAGRNVFTVANDNQNSVVANDVDALLSDINGIMKADVKDIKGVKKHNVSEVADMQAKNISSILGAGESVVITVGEKMQGGKKDGAGALSNPFFPVICENVDGDTEIISGQNILSPVERTGVSENTLSFAENENLVDAGVKEQKVSSGNIVANADVFTNLLKSEIGDDGDDGKLNISGLSGLGYSNNAKIMSSLKHPKEVSEIKPEINIDDVADQIKIKVGKLKEGENTVSIKLKPQELGEIQVKLNLGKDGKITAEINSSKEETHVLLQKNVEVLQKMMSDNGYKSDVSGFSFNFRGSQNGNNGNQEQQNPHRLADGDFFSMDGEDVKKEDEIVYSRRGILA